MNDALNNVTGGLAKEGEPSFIGYYTRASTPRLKARYQFEVALFGTIIFGLLLVWISLFFTIPALILAVQVNNVYIFFIDILFLFTSNVIFIINNKNGIRTRNIYLAKMSMCI